MLIPLGAWILISRRAPRRDAPNTALPLHPAVLVALAAGVGCVGGIFGVGGGLALS